MDVALLFPSRFIKSAEFGGKEVTYTISAVALEELERENGARQKKGVVSFEGIEKQWVLNRTNAECLKAMWGRETNAWLGKRVTLWAAPYTDQTTGEQITAIRVRGSPDIVRDVTFELKLPRKRAVQLVMRRTGGRAAAAPKTEPGGESPFDRLNRVAKERGHEWPAVKEGLAKLKKTKRSDVTDEDADQVLAWLNPEPPEDDAFDDEPTPTSPRPAKTNGKGKGVIIDVGDGESEADARARSALAATIARATGELEPGAQG